MPGETPLAGNLIFTGTNSHSGPETFTGTVTATGGVAINTNPLALPNTTSASNGVITFGGTPFIHDFGNGGALGTWVGLGAGNFTFSGVNNNGFGYHTLSSLTTGAANNAFGTNALAGNTTGTSNNGFGGAVLFANTTGGSNSGFGDGSLTANTTGTQNTAVGAQSLAANTTGQNSTAVGVQALSSLVGGTNTNSTAVGVTALKSVTSGTNNNGFGVDALRNVTTGSNNMAFGVAPGSGPGAAYTGAESNNIVIGNAGVTGESGIIRIGTSGTQTATYLVGTVSTASVQGTGAIAGDLTVARNSTNGALFIGTDGSQLFRSGNTASIQYGTITANFPTGAGTSPALSATVASGTQALNTASITTATCDGGVAATATGTVSTDRVIWSFNAAPTATNKYGAFLVVYAVPSTNTVTFYTCNPSATTSTPTAMTVNFSVVR